VRGAGAAVSFRSVTKRFGAATALKGFSLDLAPGEFVTLLGPSGSGKTTALNILAGFLELSEGEVLIGGKPVSSLPPERRNLGMVFQNFSLFPHLTVYENVAFPLKLRGVPRQDIRKRVMAALDMVHLSEFAARQPRTLSGGQQQRVALARSVVFEPPVLLMDESLSALDLKLREALQLEIKRLHAEIGCTILFVTHDQNEALTLSDRIAVMRDGAIVQIDTPDRIYDRPAHRFVAEFIGQTNIVEVMPGHDGRAVFPEMEGDLAMPSQRLVSIRPEKLRRVDSAAWQHGLIVFDAKVDQPLFLGDRVLYSVRLPSGRMLQFREDRGAGVAVLRAGDHARLGFRPEDAVPVTADG
jgi:putative spermidine/putrescine transport system ATP-binding protein